MNAQLATYPLITGGANPPVGTILVSGTSANVKADTVKVGTQVNGNPNPFGDYSSSGLRIKLISGVNFWPNTPTNEYHIDVPISPKANYDFNLTGISFYNNASSNSEVFFVIPMFQADGVGQWVPIAAPQSCATSGQTINFGVLNETFYNGHTYVFRLYFYGVNTTKSKDIRIKTLIFNGTTSTPPAIKPTVNTTSATAISTYAGQLQGNFKQGVGFHLTKKAGFIVSTNATPTFANSFVKYAATATSPLNETVNGLTAGTNYYGRAFAITQVDTVLAMQILPFTTFAPTVPIISTTTASNILSNKATTGGNTIDSGGYAVVEKGILYSTVNSNLTYGASLPTKSTNDGFGNSNFTTTIKNLIPNTKYYVKAYARNSLGAGYGNVDSFTTAAPVPVLTATPNKLDFGDVNFNSTSPVLSYVLTGSYLSPSVGVINLQATAGYDISTQSGANFGATTTVNYTGGSIAGTRIYVRFKTNAYGAYNSVVTHSGGGTIPDNTDTLKLSGKIIQDITVLTNSGTDFWLGNGYQENNKRNAGNAAEGKLSIYIAAGDQPAVVNVELPGMPGAVGFPKNNITIPANTIVEIKDFPTGSPSDNYNSLGLPDSRLFYTGVSKRGIHVYSNGTPVSVWLNTYANNNSAAGAMIFPTNTWNSSYTVQAYGGQKGAVAYNGGFTNNSNPNSFFFAIANEDNTPIWFTPSQDILDSSAGSIFTEGHSAALVKYQKGVTYGPVILNKGEVFNAMGYIEGSGSSANGLDLTGSKVYTNCDKKIAVFGGNGRCIVNTSNCNASQGSDQMIQQMFPKVAWGTKYISVPTKTMEYNLYRITVDDPTTLVWVNNPAKTTPLTGLINNLYYQVNSSQSLLIESDKPINVTQFIVAGDCANSKGTKGVGDPEMIILSPVQQAIDRAIVYSATIKKPSATYNGHYINVVIKNVGVPSFKLDGLVVADTGINQVTANAGTCFNTGGIIPIANAFRKQPFDTTYSIAKFKVAPGTSHILKSDYPFNAIAYGMGDGESYGYNAGTAIKNLSAINIAENPFGTDTSTTAIKTCVNNPVKIKIALPFNVFTVDSVLWDPGTNPAISPVGIVKGGLTPKPGFPGQFYATYDGTITVDGRMYNIYSSPQTYTFSQEGTFQIRAIAKGTFASECGSESINIINIIVGHDDISFTATQAGCGSKNVTIADATTPLAGTSIVKWAWNFGDGSPIDTARVGVGNAPNPNVNPHTYPANNAYYIKLTTINSVGCFSYDSVLVDLAFAINSSFTTSKDTVCVGENVSFTPTSSTNAAKWFWDFGDATIDSSNIAPNTISHSYTAAGTYIISHFIKTSAGCPSAVVKDTVVVSKTPAASFVTPSGVCLPGNTQFINSSDTSVAGAAIPYTYHWNFGTGNAGDTSNIKNPVFGYTVAPPNAVTLIATSRFGCVSTVYSQMVNNVFLKPTALVANTTDKKVCVGSNASFFDASFGTNQTVNSWYWSFGDGGTATTKDSTHRYATNETYTVKLVIGTDKGCVSDTATWSIKVNPKPIAGTIMPSSCISSGSLLFQDKSTLAADDSTQTPYTYTWNFGDGTGTFTTKDSSHTYAGIGTYYINHSITTLNGCTDTKTDTFTIEGSKPVVGVEIINRLGLCNNVDVKIIDTSRVAVGTIKKVEIRWDVINNYGQVETDNTPSNGAAGTSKSYTHRYPYSQIVRNYRLCLYAYSGSNCYDSLSFPFQPISVYGSPIVKFDTLPGICIDGAPRKINLARDSTGWFDVPARATWKYSGTAVVNDTFFPATAGVGTHLIKALYVTKQPFIGCRDSAYAPITVWALPTPDFTTSTPLCEKGNVIFTDKSTAGAGSGNISKWLWNFGEPTSGTKDTSTLQNPSHSYGAYNTYNVTLTATSDSGCSATLIPPKAVVIHPKPKVGFISPNGTCAGTPVGFTDTSKIADGTESQFTHYWNFGDPGSLGLNTQTGNPLTNPSHLYTSTPTDSVKLIVKSVDGCIDSFAVKLSNSIFPIQTPTYLANGVSRDTNEVIRVCLGKSIKFTSGIAANNFYWSFGDSVGIVNNTAAPLHTYPASNTFKGSFYVDDINGCRSKTVPINVQILALPTSIFEVSNPTCEKGMITFTDKSVAGAGTGNIKTLGWNFGDPASGALNTSTSMPTATHIYNATGSYNVNLTATSDSGCVATTAVPTIVTIHPLPKVDFSLPTSICLQRDTAIFTDLSTIADGSEAQFKHTWTFGDIASGANNIATGNPLPTAKHIYTSSANYFIKLYVESKDGCKDSSLPKQLAASVLHSKPTAYYSVNSPDKDNPRVCLGTPITFKDSSGVGVTKSYWIWGDEGLVTYLGSTPPPHLYTPAGSYYGVHFIDDQFGCRSDTSDFIALIDSFPVAIGGEKYILEATSAILTPYISGADTYLWTVVNPIGLTNDYLDFNDVKNPLCTPVLDSVVYRIDATSDGGCTAAPAYYTVKLLHTPIIPNVFSPNGDNVNDFWDITSLQYFTGSSVQVFNRYGQVVLNRFGYTKPWDGNDTNGKPLPVGVYYYIIKAGLGLQTLTGSLTILR